MLPITIQLKNGSEIVVRRVQTSDIEEYASVVCKCYRETRFLSRSADDPMPAPDNLIGFIEEIACSDKETELVALHMNQIVGYGNITTCLNRKKMTHKCDLNLSVLKDYWNMGIGKALAISLITFAENAGYEQINLNVASDNVRAILFYEHLGFQSTGREIHAMKHTNGDYSDFIFMTKFL